MRRKSARLVPRRMLPGNRYLPYRKEFLLLIDQPPPSLRLFLRRVKSIVCRQAHQAPWQMDARAHRNAKARAFPFPRLLTGRRSPRSPPNRRHCHTTKPALLLHRLNVPPRKTAYRRSALLRAVPRKHPRNSNLIPEPYQFRGRPPGARQPVQYLVFRLIGHLRRGPPLLSQVYTESLR